MTQTSPEKKCLDAALLILSRRDHSCRELRTKLRQRGHCEGAVEWAVDRCLHFNYLDDCKYAHQRASALRKKGFGPFRIRRDLMGKGVRQDLADAALDELYQTVDLAQDCRAVLEKKFRAQTDLSDRQEIRKKLYRFLLNRGFSQETALEQVALLLAEG